MRFQDPEAKPELVATLRPCHHRATIPTRGPFPAAPPGSMDATRLPERLLCNLDLACDQRVDRNAS